MIDNFIPRSREALQIASLLNKHNQLKTKYEGWQIEKSRANYFPLSILGIVFGSVAVDRVSFMLSEIKHLVVDDKYRRRGLAKKLLRRALDSVDTPFAYATIRKDNEASLRLFEYFGFKEVGQAHPQKGCNNVRLLVKKCIKQTSNS